MELDIEIVGQAVHGQDAIAITEQLQPDVVLMDLRMPVCDGVVATREIHQRFPWIRVLVLTAFDEDEYIWESLQAGAWGYLLKTTPTSQLADAIRTLHHGHCQLGPTIASKVMARLNSSVDSKQSDAIRLTDRETDILTLLATGKRNREIAQMLHLTEGTVKNYVSQVLSRLGLRDRTQAALWAKQHLKM